MPIYFNEGSYVPSSTYYVDEGVVDNIKTNIANTKDLKAQWKKVADGFVKHVWIKRYINEKQKEQLMKHYANLTDDKVYYSRYKTSFKAGTNAYGAAFYFKASVQLYCRMGLYDKRCHYPEYGTPK